MINFNEIEAKWQKAWTDAKIFESEVSDSKSFMVFGAFPYTNGLLHVGHFKSYVTPEILARYKRMRGFNVLFPMGFHATGTPILGVVKKLKSRDRETVEEFTNKYHIPEQEFQKFEDPLYLANYFVGKFEESYKKFGLSLDFRRRFVTIEPIFSKFIEWQFGKLKENGYLIQGKHPVGWCFNENNAVGMDDILHGIAPEIEDQIAIKFKVDGEDAYVLCATYRPETLPGLTNIFIKENATYALCKINGSKEGYYISRAAAEILKHQMKIEVVKDVDYKDMLNKVCISPIDGRKVPVLPGFFVKENIGTGIVMSVPAHAPFDYAALERLKQNGIKVPEPIKIIDVEIGSKLGNANSAQSKPVHIDIPALAYLEILNKDFNSAEDDLELATKLAYKEESHYGKMTAKGYEGMSEPEAREKIGKLLEEQGNAIKIYVLQNAPLFCRCGTEVVINLVDNQWFINYGDENWKKAAREELSEMLVLPGKSAKAVQDAVDWLNLRAVARSQGLGTRFPYDKNYMIESLSDSTIYPAFYTIVNLIRDTEPDRLKPEFFDYVFLAKGNIDDVSKVTGISYETIKKCKESFEYWYTTTTNCTAPEHIFSHIPMYLFNHCAIFDKKYWAKGLVINGMLLMEGEKMSKSLGNVVPIEEAISKYGVDPIRMNMAASSELYSDANFSVAAINGIQERLSYIQDAILNVDTLDANELKQIDYWLYSKLNKKIRDATPFMDIMETRDAYMQIFYNSILELKHYLARGGKNGIVVKDYLSAVSLMLQPIAPHCAEEFWHALGNTTFAAKEKWPEANEQMINEKVEKQEDMLDAIIGDAKQAIALMERKSGKKVKEIKIIIAENWKRDINNMLATEKNAGKVYEKIKESNELDKQAAADYVRRLSKKLNEVKEVNLTQEDEITILDEAKEYLQKSIGCKIVIESESTSKSERAKRSMPMKPSLDAIF